MSFLTINSYYLVVVLWFSELVAIECDNITKEKLWQELLDAWRRVEETPTNSWQSFEEDNEFSQLWSEELFENDGVRHERYADDGWQGSETEMEENIRGSSLVFVFDSTGSMKSELDQVKIGASKILEVLMVHPDVPIHNYIMIPFNDPALGPITVTTNHSVFRESMDNITAFGGGDCPERSVAAVKKALELSLPQSYIYVFTDASAKDYRLQNEVLSLVQKKKSQVDFIMTDDCGSTSEEGYRVFERIAETSSGQIYRLNKDEVKEVLKYVKVALQSNVVKLVSQRKPAAPRGKAPDEHEILIDGFLREFTISVSGESSSINLTDPKGENVDGPPRLKSLLHLDNVKIVSVKEPDPGPWKVLINSESDYSLRSTGLSGINFRHGFSSVETVNMRETNYRPLKGATCHLLVETSDATKIHNITTVDLVNANGDVIQRLRLDPVPDIPGLYKSTDFLPPNDFFYLGILGFGADGLPVKRITTTAITPQSPVRPVITVHPRLVGVLNRMKEIKCFVESVVPVSIQWYFNGESAKSRQYCNQTCEVTFLLEKVELSSEGNYTCLATNMAGTSRGTTLLVVTVRPPTTTTRNITFAQLGENALLNCFVESDLPYEVTWQKVKPRNESLDIVLDVNRVKKLQNNTLLIEGVQIEDEGWYICVAESKGGKGQGRTHLLVKIPLIVSVKANMKTFETGNLIELSCLATGTSEPKLEWRRNKEIINNKDEGIITQKGKGTLHLRISYALKEHAGVYDCHASTAEESGSSSVELVYIEKPWMNAENKTIMSQIGSEVTLRCRINGIPRPTVKWLKDGVEVTLSQRIQVLKDGELNIKEVKGLDSGEYSCVGINSAGTNADFIGLFVGSSPTFLQIPEDTKIELGEKATIPCSAYGVPSPETMWKRLDGTALIPERTSVLPSGALRIMKMDVQDIGDYECTAKNVFGSESIQVKIDIFGTEKPVPNEMMNISRFTGFAGSQLIIPCGVVLGNPAGSVTWFKDNVKVEEDTRTEFDRNGNLILRNASSSDRGTYTCFVSNWVGNSSRTFDIMISESPRIASNFSTNIKGRRGGEIIIPCPAEGYPLPTISWTKNGLPLPLSSTVYQNENGSLTISNLSEENSGTYVCKGQNSAGSTSKTMKVEVQVAPVFTEEVFDHMLNIVEGYMVLLSCNNKAFPTADVRWFKDGKPLLEKERATEVRRESIRFIANIDDAGLYKCNVTNEVGSISREFNVTVLVPPAIIGNRNNGSVKAVAGQPLVLECKVRGWPPPTILWQRNGMYLTQNTSEITVLDSGELILGNVTKDSVGSYICDAENLAGIMQHIYYVQVYYAPRIKEGGMNYSISLKEGEERSLPCSVEGNPKPLVVWRKNGLLLRESHWENMLILGDNTLLILQAGEETRGTYKCEATNEEGSTFVEYYVDVVSPPSLTPDGYHTRKKVIEGEPVVLTCPITTSVPPPMIQWLKDGKPLNCLLQERSDEAKIKLSEDQRDLTIAEAHPSDRGNYSCIATNLAGRADAKFFVDVLMTPHFEEFNHIAHRTILTGGEVALNCSVSGNPQPKVTWRKGNEAINPEKNPGVFISMDKQHLFIQNGKVHHSGTYICTAVNEVNRKEREFYVSVLEPPAIYGDLEETIDVVTGQNLSLHCSFSGVPRPQIVWFKLGDNRTTLRLEDSTEYLNIANVVCEDGGIYFCEVTNTAGMKAKKFTVTVLEPPDIENRNIIEKVVTKEGGNFSMKCKTTGHPRPNITWLHEGRIIKKLRIKRQVSGYLREMDMTDDGYVSLTIQNVTRDCEGEYTVLASNKVGVVEKKFQVSVLSEPKLAENYDSVSFITVIHAFPIVLECSVVGNPRPVLHWFHNDEPVLEDADIFFLENGLHIANSNSNHSGRFDCIAENSVGNVTLTFMVTIIEPPLLKNTTTSFSAKVSDSVFLTCEGVGGEDVSYEWFYKSKPIRNSTTVSLSNGGTRLIISSANISTSGEYTCIATNFAGFSKKTYEVEIIEAPILLNHTVDPYKSLQLHHPISLKCPFTGRPEPDISWYKNGEKITIENEDDRVKMMGPLLLIHDAVANDRGEYKCSAVNVGGTQNFTFDIDIYVSADWGSWSDWSSCSVSCGTGEQIRTRHCEFISDHTSEGLVVDRSNCRGASSEIRKCLNLCKVDGGWGTWSDWSPFSATCGEAMRRRYRHCNEPKAMNGGQECVGPDVAEEFVLLGECPSTRQWSDWSEWSVCSQSCDGGIRQRRRKCEYTSEGFGGRECRGPSTEFQSCNTQKCRGNWMEWEEWSPCSVTCGRGQRKRLRRCSSEGGICRGKNLEIERCIMNKCEDFILPAAANLEVFGKLNGRMFSQTFDADIETLDNERIVSASMNDPLGYQENWFPYGHFLLSPVAWSSAYENENAENGYSLTKGNYFSLSDIKFATGESFRMKHRGGGVDSKGALQVQIEVIGEVPTVEPHASVIIQDFDHDYIQAGPNILYSNVENDFQVEGQTLPYTWNSSIYYNSSQGTMPYLVEKLSMKDIQNTYYSRNGNVTYIASSKIGRRYEEDKCPHGLIHKLELLHCQDIDECQYGSSVCDINESCENTFGSYRCLCNNGFTKTNELSSCSDVDECLEQPNICSDYCHNTPGSFFCSCPYGFYLSEDLRSCLELIMHEKEKFLDSNTRFARNFTYMKALGGFEFETEENETEPAELQACPPGFLLQGYECKDRNECFEEMDLCDDDEICLNTLGSYQCLSIPCPEGFHRDYLTKNCVRHCKYNMFCKSKSFVSETVSFHAVTLTSSAPMETILELDVVGEAGVAISSTVFHITESQDLFRVRESQGRGMLFTTRLINKDTLYRVKIEARSFDKQNRFLYFVEFVVFITVI